MKNKWIFEKSQNPFFSTKLTWLIINIFGLENIKNHVIVSTANLISAPRIRSKWILGMTQNKLRFVTTFYPGAYLLFSLKTEISKVEVNFHFKNLLQRFFKVYSQQNYRPSHNGPSHIDLRIKGISFKASLRSNSLES